MGKRHQDRRTDRASADDVAEVERQLWEFAKRPDPPGVPEAKLRPGAFLYRVHRAWHSLGRGSGIASHSFRALRDELLKRDPPVRNLQPKLYGTSPLSQADAGSLIDVVLETWHVTRGKGTSWEATSLPRQAEEQTQSADAHDLDVIRENLLHTLFKGEDTLLLEEPVGMPPEIFFEERGRDAKAIIFATSPETVVHLAPSNAHAGFSELVGRFFGAAVNRDIQPLLIWIYRLPAIRDNAEFHQAYHALAVHLAAITNWYLRLSRLRGNEHDEAENLWKAFIEHSAFAVHGLPSRFRNEMGMRSKEGDGQIKYDDDLLELDTNFFLPSVLPVKFANHHRVRKHTEYNYGLAIEVSNKDELDIKYWLFPERTKLNIEETAETTGLPVFDMDISPGDDYDIAYKAIYLSAIYKLGLNKSTSEKKYLNSLENMGWSILSINEMQKRFLVKNNLS